ncbi:hypothetical protein [Phocaeicola plebeius]|jgi:hypothetical protein|uniref:hypothetical protein n=1 Tax=Phocaeicola plebeius TaxID=310297 RepID=UPI0026DBB1AF|nr:hypothetical protein [Phocaeicola plebeius]
MKAKPFIKWVGGKSQLIEQHKSLFVVSDSNPQNVDNFLIIFTKDSLLNEFLLRE